MIRPRRGADRPPAGATGSRPDRAASGVSVEEQFLPDVDTLPKPAGFGTEDSRSAQSFAELDSYTVPEGKVALLREVSISLEDNGQARVALNDVVFGEYSGAVDISVPLDPGVFPEGYTIRITHQSTDGTSTLSKGQVVVLEV